jgi:flagellar biosynthesis GTPase FlhF
MKICPQCKYERTEQDNLLFPDYECPSCGIIFEKDKARQELAELERKRQIERQAKQIKLKKEEKRKRRKKEELLKKQEQERKETARLKKIEAERELQEENERLKKDAEKKQLQEQLERKKTEEKEQIFLRERQEKIAYIARKNPDKIISSNVTEKVHQLFDMCPFGMAQSGKGLSIVGFGETKNKLQHARCMQKYCRLWTLKIDAKGTVYAQGCSMQFLGLSKDEITRNFSIKNMQILEDEFPANREPQNPGDDD